MTAKYAPAEEAVATALSSTQLLVSLGARQVLANSAAACAAELGSMRSTLHVLAAHLEALQGSPAQHPAAGELQVLGVSCHLPSHVRLPATRELNTSAHFLARDAACKATAASMRV